MAAVREGLDPELVHQVASPADAAELVRGVARAGDVVFLKGSRVAGLERVAAALRGRGARVTSILIAAAVGLFVTLLGTPLAIRFFRVHGWGQRIREDGPHTHLEKMGTPTMGGTVIVLAIVAAYVITRMFRGVVTGRASRS